MKNVSTITDYIPLATGVYFSSLPSWHLQSGEHFFSWVLLSQHFSSWQHLSFMSAFLQSGQHFFSWISLSQHFSSWQHLSFISWSWCSAPVITVDMSESNLKKYVGTSNLVDMRRNLSKCHKLALKMKLESTCWFNSAWRVLHCQRFWTTVITFWSRIDYEKGAFAMFDILLFPNCSKAIWQNAIRTNIKYVNYTIIE